MAHFLQVIVSVFGSFITRNGVGKQIQLDAVTARLSLSLPGLRSHSHWLKERKFDPPFWYQYLCIFACIWAEENGGGTSALGLGKFGEAIYS